VTQAFLSVDIMCTSLMMSIGLFSVYALGCTIAQVFGTIRPKTGSTDMFLREVSSPVYERAKCSFLS
jgi:hypothetical protein